MTDKHLYIIAGCNGAGKTTASFTIMPDVIDCREFVNADEIARGLSPFQPEKVAFEAGRIMLNRIKELLSNNESFAFETTLSTRSYIHTISQAKAQGYTITLLFLWLQNINLAKERVRTRVAEGGHNIEPEVIKRRYTKGIKNLFDLYLSIVDNAFIYDNSKGSYDLIARKVTEKHFDVTDQDKYSELKKYYDLLRKAD